MLEFIIAYSLFGFLTAIYAIKCIVDMETGPTPPLVVIAWVLFVIVSLILWPIFWLLEWVLKP